MLAYVDEIVSDVLILVLMEYGLWRIAGPRMRIGWEVLILVLMEYGLWQEYMGRRSHVEWS